MPQCVNCPFDALCIQGNPVARVGGFDGLRWRFKFRLARFVDGPMLAEATSKNLRWVLAVGHRGNGSERRRLENDREPPVLHDFPASAMHHHLEQRALLAEVAAVVMLVEQPLSGEPGQQQPGERRHLPPPRLFRQAGRIEDGGQRRPQHCIVHVNPLAMLEPHPQGLVIAVDAARFQDQRLELIPGPGFVFVSRRSSGFGHTISGCGLDGDDLCRNLLLPLARLALKPDRQDFDVLVHRGHVFLALRHAGADVGSDEQLRQGAGSVVRPQRQAVDVVVERQGQVERIAIPFWERPELIQGDEKLAALGVVVGPDLLHQSIQALSVAGDLADVVSEPGDGDQGIGRVEAVGAIDERENDLALLVLVAVITPGRRHAQDRGQDIPGMLHQSRAAMPARHR